MSITEELFTIRTFHHSIDRPTTCFHQTIAYDVQIPLPDNANPLDLLGNLVVKERVPLFAHKEVADALRKFIWEETRKQTAEFAGKLLRQRLEECGFDGAKLFQQICSDETTTIFQPEPSLNIGKEDVVTGLPPFEEQFQQVMRQSTPVQLAHLMREEATMTEEMRMLVQARDFELDRLEKACETSLLLQSSQKLDKLEQFDKHSQQLSLLNAEIRQVSLDYSRQTEALLKRQRRDYRELVRKLYKNEPVDDENGTHPHGNREKTGLLSSSLSHNAGFLPSVKEKGNKFKKSISCDEKMTQIGILPHSSNSSESFSIYIGSQLKTMHNARILACSRLSDLCICQPSSSSSPSPSSDAHFDDLSGSKRLHLLMNLYGRDLSAVVLLVEPDPLWHVHSRSHFARLCDSHSAELHFDSLETQLGKIEAQVRVANRKRRERRALADLSQLSYSPPIDHGDANEAHLQPGDVYVTRHSNLPAVQLVFHLVGDSALAREELSSRHPCIGGLRNIVRLAARSAIRNISFPLLLVDGEYQEESMPSGWCQSRAELVFKCLKGFLMEVCSSGGCSNSSSSPVPAGPSQSLHFNINFALPSALPPPLFRQMLELFTSIYYLVPSLNA